MFGFMCHMVSLQLLKPAVCNISQGQHVKERVWLCSNASLFMSIEMWISCNIHASQNVIIIIILVFPQPFKDLKSFLAAGITKTEGWQWFANPWTR